MLHPDLRFGDVTEYRGFRARALDVDEGIEWFRWCVVGRA